MIGNETLSNSKYFVLIKGRHRKQKTTKVHYTIREQRSFYLAWDDEVSEEDLTRIRKIADPHKNYPNKKKLVWNYENYTLAHKVFMMLILNGY